MVTIKDVARRAGVSPGTVSNALTGKRGVSKEVHDRIQQAIDELDYQPNFIARSLVNQRSRLIAIVSSAVQYYGPMYRLVGVETRASELGYTLILQLAHDWYHIDAKSLVSNLISHQVDGIIWAVPQIAQNNESIRKLYQIRHKALPPIVFMATQPVSNCWVSDTDDRIGARIATQHLIDIGRRNIAIISGPQDWWEARERLEGWKTALSDAGLSASESLFYHGDWFAPSGWKGLQQLLNDNPNLDAIFVSNDQMAFSVIYEANRLGIRIPDDIAIVGYDNTIEAQYTNPPLTTVEPHLVQAGIEALNTLHQLVENRDRDANQLPSHYTAILPDLIKRSTA